MSKAVPTKKRAEPESKPAPSKRYSTPTDMQAIPQQPTPFAFQEKAIQRCIKHLSQGAKTLLVSPTGSGKTVMAGHIAIKVLSHLQKAGHFGRVAAFCTSTPLKEQLEERLCPAYTVQGLLKGQRPEFKPDLCIWDEAHHSEADEWAEARKIFPQAAVLGLTPTPQRGDGRALTLFDEMEVAAHYSELIQEGVIVPCRVVGPDRVHGDKRPDPVKSYMKAAGGKKAIFFLTNIEEANDVAKQLTRNKVAATAYHSEMTKGQRRAMFAAFASSELTCITTVYALSEGIDVPDAEVAVLAQPCHGVGQYLNTVGRVLRAANGKTKATLIDLAGASLRHGWPTIDREYSMFGAGISGGGGDMPERDYEYSGRESVPTYDAKIVQWYDWKWPSADDKRRQMGFLRHAAAANGYSEEMAAEAFRVLFGKGTGQ